MKKRKQHTPCPGFSQQEIDELIYDDSYFYRFVQFVDKLKVGKLRIGFNGKTVFLFFFVILGGLVYLAFSYDGIVAPTGVDVPSSIFYQRSLGVFFVSDWYRLFLIFGVNPLVFSGLTRLYVDDLPAFFRTILSRVTSKNYQDVRKKFDHLREKRVRKRSTYAVITCAVITVLLTVWIWVWKAQGQPSGFYSLRMSSAPKLFVLLYNYSVTFALSYSLFQLRGTLRQFKELLSLITETSTEGVGSDLQNAVHSFRSPFTKIFSIILAGLFSSAVIKNIFVPAIRTEFDGNRFAERNLVFIFYYLALLAVSLVAYFFIKRGIRKCYPVKLRKPQPWFLAGLISLAIVAGAYIATKGIPYLLRASDWELFYSLLPFAVFSFATSLTASLIAIWIYTKISKRGP